jgi:hypothetical protein
VHRPLENSEGWLRSVGSSSVARLPDCWPQGTFVGYCQDQLKKSFKKNYRKKLFFGGISF